MDDLKNDIEKYLKGELSSSEMHALEKKALNDPFLEDALEGSAQLPTEALEADLRMLEATLSQRTKPGRKTISLWMWPMRIAAGLILIAISTFVIIEFTGNKPSEDLAVKSDSVATPEEVEAQPPVSTDSVATPRDSYLSHAKPEAPTSSRAQTNPLKDSEAVGDHTTQLEKEPEVEPVGPAPVVADVPKPDEVTSADEIIAEEKVAQASPDQSRAQRFRKVEANEITEAEIDALKGKVPEVASSRAADDMDRKENVIRGKVTAEDGTGLPGVNVMVKGTNIGTVTDALGNYQLSVSEENADLFFSFIGYLNSEVNTGGKDEVNLQMSEDVAQLSEIVIVGYGDGPMDGMPTEPLEVAEPAGGRRAFKQYLEQGLRYPEQALANNVEGKVIVMFTVETTGQLSEFRVLRGIGNGCDEEVIRLIKEGPKWSPSKRRDDPVRDKVKVRMRFALPKDKK